MPPSSSRKYKKKSSKKTARPSRKMGSKMRPKRSIRESTDYATITETTETAVGPTASGSSVCNSVNIQDFSRALAVAQNFMFYRITKVEYVYTPFYNTFQQAQVGSSGDNVGVPIFHMLMNRTGTLNSLTTLDSLQACGAQPRKWTKQIRVAYKPNLLQTIVVASGGNGDVPSAIGAEPVYDKWLSTEQALKSSLGTNPQNALIVPSFNSPAYYGHNHVITQNDDVPGTELGILTCHVTFQFKIPSVNPTTVTGAK